MEDKANVRAIFEQCWTQARHIENERLWLSNIFGIIFTALLGLVSVYGMVWYIPVFGALVSIVGLLAAHDLRIWFIRFSRLAEKIAVKELGGKKYDIGKYRQKEFVSSLIRLPSVFAVFYSGIFTLWIVVLLIGQFGSGWWLWMVSIIITCLSLVLYRYVLLPRERRAEEEVMRQE